MHQAESPIVVIGASSGGIQALLELIAELPAAYSAPVFVVVHVGTARSLLPNILARGSQLPASHADHGERFEPGHVYVAPPDCHMLVRGDRIELSHGPREKHSRPAIDPLFRSAARSHGPRVVGIILSGALSDGTTGLLAVKSHGGTAGSGATRRTASGRRASPARRIAHGGVPECVATHGKHPSRLTR